MKIDKLLNPCPLADATAASRVVAPGPLLPPHGILTPPPTARSQKALLQPQPVRPTLVPPTSGLRTGHSWPTVLGPLDGQKFRSAGCDDTDMLMLGRLMADPRGLQDVIWLRRHLTFFRGLGFSARQCVKIICRGTPSARVKLLEHARGLLQYGLIHTQLLALLRLRDAAACIFEMRRTGVKILQLGYSADDVFRLVAEGPGISNLRDFWQQAQGARLQGLEPRAAHVEAFLRHRLGQH